MAVGAFSYNCFARLYGLITQVRLVFFSAEGTDRGLIFTLIFLVTVLLAVGAPFRCGHHFRGFVVFIFDH